MKRFISLLSVILLLSAAVFADDYFEDDEEYDDGYVYTQNGAGDQFLKIDLGANFPLNFNGKMYPGVIASVGYYRFFNENFAVGGDAILGYNLSIGKKPVITVPVTIGVLYQPTFGKFEFPLMLNIGFASTTCQRSTHFPSFALKFTGGAYYRYSESWSFGLSSHSYWIPQLAFVDWWKTDKEKNDHGLFTSIDLSIRYHF